MSAFNVPHWSIVTQYMVFTIVGSYNLRSSAIVSMSLCRTFLPLFGLQVHPTCSIGIINIYVY